MPKLKTTVGQIFLTHNKDENFTSIYEEAFFKNNQPVELFVILEVEPSGPEQVRLRRDDYEKLAAALVSSFKKTYVASVQIDEETFEKALAAINAALSRFGARVKLDWYGKLNAAVAALSDSKLALSVTGNAQGLLWRKNDFIMLSEDLAEKRSRAVKIFSNYSFGSLAKDDRVILSTNQLFNFLSLDRLREFIREETVAETCREIISALADVKSTGFASFIFEMNTPGQELAERSLQPAERAAKSKKPGAAAIEILLAVLSAAAAGLASLARGASFMLFKFFRVKPKKFLITAIGIIALVLAGSIGFSVIKKIRVSNQQEKVSAAAEISGKLDEAEAALIYGDESRIASLLAETRELLKKTDDEASRSRFADLENKINKETKIENPALLSTFPNIPTRLLHSPNGFLGFNNNTGSLAFYDFRTGAAQAILQNQNTVNLHQGAYRGKEHGFVFLKKDGTWAELQPDKQELNQITSATSTDASAEQLGRSQGLAILGEDALSRLYILDAGQNQIWRLRTTDTGLAAAEKWLKTEADFAGVRDLSVDGSVYALFPDRLEKYFNGTKQNWQLSAVNPSLTNAVKIFTRPDYQDVYILEPEKKRILIFNKQGKFQRQITSEKFRELVDIHADEANGIIYALTGPELLQINLK